MPSKSSLPHEVYLSIFSHLTNADLLSASRVNHRWHHSSLPLLYAHLYLSSSTQLSLLHKYNLIPRHSRLIRNITLYRIYLTSHDKLTLMNECRSLISITLIKCANVDSKFLRELVKANMFSLERFCIWGDSVPGNNLANETVNSTEITDDLLTPMLEFCGNLRELKVCGAEITDEFLTDLASSLNDQVSSSSSSSSIDENLANNENTLYTCNSPTYITINNEDSTQTINTNSPVTSNTCSACTDCDRQMESDNTGPIFLDISQDAFLDYDRISYSHPSTSITCPHLTTLDLTECFNLTAFGVAELFSPQQLPKFHVLILQYNPQNDLDLEFFEFLADNFKSHVFRINVLNSKRFNGKNKALQTSARISKDLNILGKRRNNVRVVKQERKMTDDDILKIFGRGSEISMNKSKRYI